MLLSDMAAECHVMNPSDRGALGICWGCMLNTLFVCTCLTFCIVISQTSKVTFGNEHEPFMWTL
jgi:Na+/alanine symporter